MSFCPDCAKADPDKELEAIKQLAKKYAIENQEAQAIYKDGEYKYISAHYAYQSGYNVLYVVSHLT